MRTQLLSGVGNRVLSSVFICCLWACVVPADARAQAKFSSATCASQSVTNGKMVQWQIKGTAQVTGLNPGGASTTVTFTFQRKANGAMNWTDLSPTVTQTTNGVNGTADFDTGWQNISAPGQGDQYRVSVNGFYIDGTGKQVNLMGIASTPITPNP